MIKALEVKGMLREVDLERNSCQIFPPTGVYIQCQFEKQLRSAVKDLLDQYVVARGEATLRKSDGRIRTLRINDIEILECSPDSLEDKTPPKPETGKELLAALQASGFVGMWKNRLDIPDSVEYAQTLRKRAQTRGK